MKTYKDQPVSDEMADYLEKRDALLEAVGAVGETFLIKSADAWEPLENDEITPAQYARERADLSRAVKSALESFEWAIDYLKSQGNCAGLISDTGEFYFQVWDDAQAHRISMAEEFFKGLRHVAKSETVEVQEA